MTSGHIPMTAEVEEIIVTSAEDRPIRQMGQANGCCRAEVETPASDEEEP